MKCTFSASSPRLLIEMRPGELFVPLGPSLVECVCAVKARTMHGVVDIDVPRPQRYNVDGYRPVIVLACRVDAGDAEYHVPGEEVWIPAASPVAMLEQVEALALREQRADREQPELWPPGAANAFDVTVSERLVDAVPNRTDAMSRL